MAKGFQQIVSNLARVRAQIDDAARRRGGAPDDVRLVAVTKYVDPDTVRVLFEAGCHEIGESRPQELWAKADALADLPIRWHLIGHLQRNKINRTLPLTWMLQAVDSQRLLEAVQAWGTAHQRQLPLLLEVNISGETAKHGFAPDQVAEAVSQAARVSWTPVKGLMCMASLKGGSSQAHTDFARLRELRDALRQQLPEGPPLNELSMGMSADFTVAVEEGATIVRVGSALFEGVVD